MLNNTESLRLQPDNVYFHDGESRAMRAAHVHFTLEQRWPWLSRERTAPSLVQVLDGELDLESRALAEKEGDYNWIHAQWDIFYAMLLRERTPMWAKYLSRLARIQALSGDWKGGLAAANAALPGLRDDCGFESEEAFFCEETVALAGERRWGAAKSLNLLEDLAGRACRALSHDSPQIGRALSSWARIASLDGNRAMSRMILKELIERDIKIFGLRHRFTIADRLRLAVEDGLAGELREAFRQACKCSADAERDLGPDHPLSCLVKIRLGELLEAAGHHAEAVTELAEAAGGLDRSVGRGHYMTMQCDFALAKSLYSAGQADLALKTIAGAAERLVASLGAESPEGAAALTCLEDMKEGIRQARKARRGKRGGDVQLFIIGSRNGAAADGDRRAASGQSRGSSGEAAGACKANGASGAGRGRAASGSRDGDSAAVEGGDGRGQGAGKGGAAACIGRGRAAARGGGGNGQGTGNYPDDGGAGSLGTAEGGGGVLNGKGGGAGREAPRPERPDAEDAGLAEGGPCAQDPPLGEASGLVKPGTGGSGGGAAEMP
ncbi:MAG: hypothetical protein LBW85_03295 [Deltaproteobacteria bacterium]|jgi:tetratricopeptide (TPR) repeat protein|nr:hypothetical protein [Deltaproteobacteria bacterium]